MTLCLLLGWSLVVALFMVWLLASTCRELGRQCVTLQLIAAARLDRELAAREQRDEAIADRDACRRMLEAMSD